MFSFAGKIIALSTDQQESDQYLPHIPERRGWLSNKLGLLSWLIAATALVLLAFCSFCVLYGLYQLETAMHSKDTTITNLENPEFIQEIQTTTSINVPSEQITEWNRLLLKRLYEIRPDHRGAVDNNERDDVDEVLRIMAIVLRHANEDFAINNIGDKQSYLVANLTELEARVVKQELVKLSLRGGGMEDVVLRKLPVTKRMRREIDGAGDAKEGKCHFRFSYDPAKGHIGKIKVTPVPRGQGMIRVSNTLNDGKSVRQCFFDIVYESIDDKASN
ncbi:hypothetical protein QAD02_019851 [Eretmocerus hayati]|uniref:Uncharacterized protein n=1 Tax=Eretmocerus hayati TaxID=131215 RepID=A0ACC2PL97_9HYME|nr:hypothetical protein QAD02_019851 [Eretmocerus hayati]